MKRSVEQGRIQGKGAGGAPLPPPEMTYGFLIQLVFCKKKNYVVYPGAEVEQQTSAPPPKKNPGSAPVEVYLYQALFTDPEALVFTKSVG